MSQDAGLTGNVADAAAGSDDTTGDGVFDATGGDATNQQTEQGNPAWSGLLEALPSSLHSVATPHLKQWDQNYQKTVQDYQSQIEPWKPLQEAGIDPKIALGIINMLNNDPQQLVTALLEANPEWGPKQAQQAVANAGDDPASLLDLDYGTPAPQVNLAELPEYVALKAQADQQTAFINSIIEKQQEEQFNTQIANEIESIKNDPKRGEFPEEIVLSLASTVTGGDITKAYDIWKATQPQPAKTAPPLVLPPFGGAAAGEQVNTTKLGRQGRQDLIVEMLKAQHEQG